MRKIILTPYKIDTGEDYKVRQSLLNVMFSPHLHLTARAIIEQDKIACKIEAAGDAVLLEESEYERVKTAVETFEGYQRNDREFVRRVLDAETVCVEEVAK